MDAPPLERTVVSVSGSRVELRIRLPHRGLGIFLMIFAPFFLAFVGLGIIESGKPTGQTAGPILIAVGIGLMLILLVAGLFLATRLRRAVLDGPTVVSESGWLLRRRRRQHEVSEFEGLSRHTNVIAKVDAEAVIGGVIAGAAGGVGRTKMREICYLTLKHAGSRSKDVLLACDFSTPAVMALMDHLAALLSLPILGADAAPDGPLGPCPFPVLLDERQGLTVISAPCPRMFLYGAICFAVPFFIISVVGMVLDPRRTGVSQAGFILIPLAIGLAIVGLGVLATRKRLDIEIEAAGLSLIPFNQHKKVTIPWADVRQVSVAKEPTSKQPAVRIETPDGDLWFRAGVRRSSLEWIQQAILTHRPA